MMRDKRSDAALPVLQHLVQPVQSAREYRTLLDIPGGGSNTILGHS